LHKKVRIPHLIFKHLPIIAHKKKYVKSTTRHYKNLHGDIDVLGDIANIASAFFYLLIAPKP